MPWDRRRLVGAGHVAISLATVLAAPAITRGGAVAYVLFLVLVAASTAYGLAWLAVPGRVADRFEAWDLAPTWPVVLVAGLLLIDVLAVLGAPVVYAVGSIERRLAGAGAPGYSPVVPGLAELAVRRAVNMLFWCGPVVAFLAVAYGREELRDELGLRGGLKELLVGGLWTVPVFLLLTGTATFLASLGIGGSGGGTSPLIHALLVSVTAGIGEEVFFRGFLQPRIGLVAQALWFGVEHAGYMSITAMVGAAIAGVAFGLAYRETDSLYVPIVAHAAYDVIVIAFV